MSRKIANATMIGQRYAKAFFSANLSEQEVHDFIDLTTLIIEDPQFNQILDLHKNGIKSQNSLLEWVDALSKQLKLSPKVSNFLKLIIHKKRLGFLSDVTKSVIDLNNQKIGAGFVKLTLFEQGSDTQIEAIKQTIKESIGFEPILKVEIDPSILGGYIIQTRSIVIDNSLKKRIAKLHNIMKGVA